jgi:archaeal type IV pilus assembly protein PilA
MRSQNERAVSPVVGVMLMLVVVIIIAAVVSGFAGSLVGGKNQKTPQLAMDAEIVNTGYWSSSYFKAVATGVDGPIKTHDLKIITSWTKTLQNGSRITGGTTITPGVNNFNVIYDTHGSGSYDDWRTVVPQGYGPGVGENGTEFANFWPVEGSGLESNLNNANGNMTNFTWFGNYRLQAGTIMFARPFGGKLGGQSAGTGSFSVGYGIAANATAGITGGGRFQYAFGTDWTGSTSCLVGMNPKCGGAIFNLPKSQVGQSNPSGSNPVDPNDPLTYSTDQMQAILGDNWNRLRGGDTVTMKVIHTPTGKTIWQKDIIVQGA